MKKIILTSVSCLALASCGFSPMHGKYAQSSVNDMAVQENFARIHIENIPDREGQILRNALIDRFYRSGRPADPLYRLKIEEIRETSRDLDITKSSDSTREQLRLDTVMTLVDAETGREVLKRNLYTLASYNVLDNEFASRVSKRNARESALSDLARQVELQTALYFN